MFCEKGTTVLQPRFNKVAGLIKKKDFNTGVLTNFAKFTVKLMCQSLFFNKVAGASCNFIKKETLA